MPWHHALAGEWISTTWTCLTLMSESETRTQIFLSIGVKILLWCRRSIFLFPCSCVLDIPWCFPLLFLGDSSVTVHSVHLNSKYQPFSWTCCCYFTSDLCHKSSPMFPLLEPILAPYEALYCFTSLSSSCRRLLPRIKICSEQSTWYFRNMLGDFIARRWWSVLNMLECLNVFLGQQRKNDSHFSRRCKWNCSHNHKRHQK